MIEKGWLSATVGGASHTPQTIAMKSVRMVMTGVCMYNTVLCGNSPLDTQHYDNSLFPPANEPVSVSVLSSPRCQAVPHTKRTGARLGGTAASARHTGEMVTERPGLFLNGWLVYRRTDVGPPRDVSPPR